MAKRFRFKKPKNMSVVMTEVISLAVWLVFGDKVIDVLNNLVGVSTTNVNVSMTNITVANCVDTSVFFDAYKFLGIGSDCSNQHISKTATELSNTDNGLLGIVALVMVALILMNFISYK